MGRRHHEGRKRRQREAAEAESRRTSASLADIPPADPVNPVAVALEEIVRREREAGGRDGGEAHPEEPPPEVPDDLEEAPREREGRWHRRRRRRHDPPPAREVGFDWRSALDTRGLLYMGVALFVAVLVFLVLRYLEMRDLAPPSVIGS